MTAMSINRARPWGSDSPRVVVIGGGLAGMAAAIALESAGLGVTLVESRRSLGGRAGSFEDPQSGEQLDNSQHVLLGCCTNLIDFYRRLGVPDRIRFNRDIRFRDCGGREYRLSGLDALPAPLHLAPSLLRFGALTMREKISLGRAMVAMMRLGRPGREALSDVSFGDWLDEHRQEPSLIEKLYDPLLIGSLNELTRRASAKYAIQVFQDAMLANSRGYVLGLPTCPLGRLYEGFSCRDLRLGVRVTELQFAEGAISAARLSTGEVLAADLVVIATSHQSLRRLVPEEVLRRDERFAGLGGLEAVPILGAHLWFDRPVMSGSHAAMLSEPLQWVFRKDREGRCIRAVISAARQWLDVPREQALLQFQRQIHCVFPRAAGAKLERAVVLMEKRATFAPVPGVDRLRPPQAPPSEGIRNLILAGDYTQTNWPATMEGAVRSGYLAAEEVLRAVGRAPRRRFLAPDLPMQLAARILSGT